MDSSNSTPGDYRYEYSVAPCGEGGGELSVALEYTIATEPTAAQSYVTVNASRAPVLGERWRGGATIYAVDADGDPVADAARSFAVALTSGDGSYVAACEPVSGEGATIDVECGVPDVATAGDWQLNVTNKGAFVQNGRRRVPARCQAGTFERNGRCRACIDGAACEVPGLEFETLPVKENFWRPTRYSETLYRCEYHGACEEGGCTDGHIGVECRVCDEDYHYDTTQFRCVERGARAVPIPSRRRRPRSRVPQDDAGICRRRQNHRKCRCAGGSSGVNLLLILGAVVVLGCFAAACLLIWFARKYKTNVLDLLGVFVRGDEAMKGEEDKFMDRKRMLSLKTKVKILVGVFQVQNALPAVLPAITYPAGFETVLAWTSIFEFDFLRIMPVSCVRKVSFYDTLLVTTLSPIAISLVMVLICQTMAARTAGVRAREIRVFAFGAVLLVTIIVFPSVSTAVLSFFNCVEREKGLADGTKARFNVLAVDYGVSCDDGKYKLWSAYAALMMAVRRARAGIGMRPGRSASASSPRPVLGRSSSRPRRRRDPSSDDPIEGGLRLSDFGRARRSTRSGSRCFIGRSSIGNGS